MTAIATTCAGSTAGAAETLDLGEPIPAVSAATTADVGPSRSSSKRTVDQSAATYNTSAVKCLFRV